MVKMIRAHTLVDALAVGRRLEFPNASERRVTAPLRAVPYLTATYGLRVGGSKREKAPDYRRVLNVDLGPKSRLIVCRDEMQVVHQRYIGGEWRGKSFHQTLNGQLEGILKTVRSPIAAGSCELPSSNSPIASQRGIKKALHAIELPAHGTGSQTEAQNND